MDKIICYFFQGGTVFSDDKLDRAKKLKLPYIYVKSDKIIEYGNFPNGWTLWGGFNLMDVRGTEKKVNYPKKIFTIIQFKDWLDYYEFLLRWVYRELESLKNKIDRL